MCWVSEERMAFIINKPTMIEWQGYRFLIMDAPTDQNIHLYIKELDQQNITDVVRTCEPTYDKSAFLKAGIRFHELEFTDGSPPGPNIISYWLDLVEDVFNKKKLPTDKGDCGIAIHCIAGLGRAPVLAAIAFIEKGVDAIEAVEFIRRKRRGAINLRQLTYLEKYQRTRPSAKDKCILM